MGNTYRWRRGWRCEDLEEEKLRVGGGMSRVGEGMSRVGEGDVERRKRQVGGRDVESWRRRC
jgi:hypothetical protein